MYNVSRMLPRILAGVVLFGFLSCGSEPAPPTPLIAGSIAGQYRSAPYVPIYGAARNYPDDYDQLFILFSNVEITCDDAYLGILPKQVGVFAKVKATAFQEGTQELEDASAKFSEVSEDDLDDDIVDNWLSMQGTVNVTSIAETTVEGSVTFPWGYPEGNVSTALNGDFKVVRCPDFSED